MQMPFVPSRVANALLARGVQVRKTTAGEECTDGEVRITDEVHVQVGDTYLVVNRWAEDEEAMYHGPSRTSLDEVILDINAALNKTGRYTPQP